MNVAVLDDDQLVFIDYRSPGTVRNLARNPAMEINVVDPIRRKGYRFKGTAEVLAEGDRFNQALEVLGSERAVRRDRVRGVVVLCVETAAPLISPIYDLGACEDEVAAQWLQHHVSLQRLSPS